MEVKRSSWHYRFHKHISNMYVEPRKVNLCVWFFTIVRDIMKCVAVTAVVIVIAITFYELMWPDLMLLTITDIITALMYIGTLIAMVVLPSLAIYALRRYWGDTEVPIPNILIEFYKAKKGHYCPPITFVD